MKINKSIEEGEERILAFARSLVERAGVAEGEREAEAERLKEKIVGRILDEVLTALPEEDLDEMQAAMDETGELPLEKWNSMMFMEKIRPESVAGKVFREVEQEYLGDDNTEEEE